MDSSYVGKDGLTGLCRSSHVQRLCGSIMSASNHRTQGTGILLLGKISVLPEKGAALLSAPHRAGAGGGAPAFVARSVPHSDESSKFQLLLG